MVQDFANLYAAIAWPTVAVIALIVLRKPLSSFLEDIGKRATKVSLFQFAVELSTVTDEPIHLTLEVGDAPAQLGWDSEAEIRQILTDTTKGECAVVNLGSGDQWLASRLFLLAALMPEVRGLRSFVFVETHGDVRERFIGIADARSVRWAFASNYLGLESAFATAYAEAVANSPLTTSVDTIRMGTLVNRFLTAIQELKVPAGEQSRWAPVPKPPLVGRSGDARVPKFRAKYYEKSQWLDAEQLEKDLGDVLQTDSFVLDAPDLPAATRAQNVLRRKGPFVAVLNEEHRFKDVIDRESLLEAAGRQLANVTS